MTLEHECGFVLSEFQTDLKRELLNFLEFRVLEQPDLLFFLAWADQLDGIDLYPKINVGGKLNFPVLGLNEIDSFLVNFDVENIHSE